MRMVSCGLLLLACGAELNNRSPDTRGLAGSPVDASAHAKMEAVRGSAGGSSDAETASGSACPQFEAGKALGKIASAEVTEASGIIASRKNQGVLFVHNDSGDGPRVFAMGLDGTHLAELTLSNAKAKDWEDLATGPGPTPNEHYLYLGDIGDNKSTRAFVNVYRVAEPVINPAGPAVARTLRNVETFTLTYADGPHNAEALFVDPKDGKLYILTKTDTGVSQLFQSPGPLPAGGGNVTMTEATRLMFGQGALAGSPLVTGGDISPGGDMLAVRTYVGVFLWRRSPGQAFAQAFQSAPCAAPSLTEQQGESVGFAADSQGYFTVSEGSSQNVHFFARK